MGFAQFGDLLFQFLVVAHIEVTDKMVALLASGLRRAALAEALVGNHRLADVDAAVVDQIHLRDGVPRAFEDGGGAHADGVVAHVAEVLRLVGVRRGELNQDFTALGGGQQCVIHQRGLVGDGVPHQRGGLEGDVHEGLGDLDLLDIGMAGEELPDLLGNLHRILAQCLGKREAGDRHVAVKALRAQFGGDFGYLGAQLLCEVVLQVFLECKIHFYI